MTTEKQCFIATPSDIVRLFDVPVREYYGVVKKSLTEIEVELSKKDLQLPISTEDRFAMLFGVYCLFADQNVSCEVVFSDSTNKHCTVRVNRNYTNPKNNSFSITIINKIVKSKAPFSLKRFLTSFLPNWTDTQYVY